MLNSRYAPPIALAVVVAMIIAALGYFLGVKPTLDDVGAIQDRKSEVEKNIKVIEEDSEAIDESAKLLSSTDDPGEVIAFNAPSTVDFAAFQKRLLAAVRATNVEIKTVTASAPVLVEPLVVPPTLRPSTDVASHFESLALRRNGSEPKTESPTEPVVKAAGAEDPVVDSLYQVDVSFEVTGSPAEIVGFLKTVTDPTQRLLLVHAVQGEARQKTDTADPGMGPYKDGDLIMKVSSSLFLLDPDITVVDEDSDIDFVLPADGGLLMPEPIEPQPGANK